MDLILSSSLKAGMMIERYISVPAFMVKVHDRASTRIENKNKSLLFAALSLSLLLFEIGIKFFRGFY